jgi:hypothetical protein
VAVDPVLLEPGSVDGEPVVGSSVVDPTLVELALTPVDDALAPEDDVPVLDPLVVPLDSLPPTSTPLLSPHASNQARPITNRHDRMAIALYHGVVHPTGGAGGGVSSWHTLISRIM